MRVQLFLCLYNKIFEIGELKTLLSQLYMIVERKT